MNYDLTRQLDAFPHIQQRLAILWGTRECRHYIHNLIVGEREDGLYRTSKGFPLHIALVLTELLGDHDLAFPQFIPTGSVWDPTAVDSQY